jgi:hypothetical protein
MRRGGTPVRLHPHHVERQGQQPERMASGIPSADARAERALLAQLVTQILRGPTVGRPVALVQQARADPPA